MSTCQPLPPKFKSDKRLFSPLSGGLKKIGNDDLSYVEKGFTRTAQTEGRQGENELLTWSETEQWELNFWAPQREGTSGTGWMLWPNANTIIPHLFFISFHNSWHLFSNRFVHQQIVSCDVKIPPTQMKWKTCDEYNCSFNLTLEKRHQFRFITWKKQNC